jgi:hypothetical protein
VWSRIDREGITDFMSVEEEGDNYPECQKLGRESEVQEVRAADIGRIFLSPDP